MVFIMKFCDMLEEPVFTNLNGNIWAKSQLLPIKGVGCVFTEMRKNESL